MQVSFVIPLYNNLPLTQAMVASLRATLPRDLAHEIILVDDGSTDGTRAWLATLTTAPFRVVLNERNLGYAGANNRGAAVARGKFLALLNNDLVLTPGWLEPMLAAHRTLAAHAGLIGNVQLDAHSGAVDHAGIAINAKGKPEHIRVTPSAFARFFRPVQSADAVTGACLLLERALWEQLGGFDEAYVNGCEDVDLCFRARAAGRLNAVALRSVIRHHVSSSLGRKLRDEENNYRLARRWRDEFARLAGRRWCWRYLEAHWTSPRDTAEYATARRLLTYALHLRRTHPPDAAAAMLASVDLELARWREMFER
jgi:O-antigen biosynthesis protein